MKNFQDFLAHKFMKAKPQVLDDDMPDALDAWISGLETQEIIDFADDYATEIRNEPVNHGGSGNGPTIMERIDEIVKQTEELKKMTSPFANQAEGDLEVEAVNEARDKNY